MSISKFANVIDEKLKEIFVLEKSDNKIKIASKIFVTLKFDTWLYYGR